MARLPVQPHVAGKLAGFKSRRFIGEAERETAVVALDNF
jgi:hypothetical protein